MIRGSCLCGGVRYEIAGEIRNMTHCHCSMCRKGHGAAFATYAEIRSGDIRFSEGQALISRYRSSDKAQRSFCSRCGSNLSFELEEAPSLAWIAVGGFDSDPGREATAHIYVDSKAPWYAIGDSLPQHAGDL